MLLVLPWAPAAAGQVEVVREGSMHVASTRHYRVRSDLGAGPTRRIALAMETVGGAYYQVLQEFGGERLRVFDVTVFHDRRDYMNVVGPANANTLGVYRADTRQTYACVGDDLEAVLEVLRHEGFHQFAHHFLGDGVPVWINEGLAQYFQFARLREGRLEAGEVPVAPLRTVQTALRAGEAVGLADLMRWDTVRWNANRQDNPRRGDLAYAQAFLLTHFLMESDGRRHRRLVGAYLRRINADRGAETALRAVFGTDLRPLEKRWAEYVAGLEPSPRFVCRGRLETLGRFLCAGPPGEGASAEAVRERAARALGAGAADALFRCPLDKGPAGQSGYTFVGGGAGRWPEVECRHHEGYVIRLTVRVGAEGPRPVVSEAPTGEAREDSAGRTP